MSVAYYDRHRLSSQPERLSEASSCEGNKLDKQTQQRPLGVCLRRLLRQTTPAKACRATEAAVALFVVRGANAVGGGGRDRTDDLRLAKPSLSQLSYAPSLHPTGFSSVAHAIDCQPTEQSVHSSHRLQSNRCWWAE